jgi:1-deoxy-D-xylulose 5-phosphate reductoisomerase
MNAVNEEAVNAFLRNETSFGHVIRAVESSLEDAPSGAVSLESVLEVDAEARAKYRRQH